MNIDRIRLLAYLEGSSLLILLFIAMPLKYLFDTPLAVTYVGWVHGLLFMVFIFSANHASKKFQWSDTFLGALLLSSIIPFGMFFMDRKLRERA